MTCLRLLLNTLKIQGADLALIDWVLWEGACHTGGQFLKLRVSAQRSFSVFDEAAQSLAECTCQLVGHINSNIDPPEFYRTYTGAMNSSLFCKLFLRQIR